jgi:hypothetical protein
MKTKFFFFAMLASVAASAQTLNIKIVTIDYSTKIATCDLSWTGRNVTHVSDVWVFVDFIEISGSTTTGSWKPATITGATVTKNTFGTATASMVSGNTRGVWIKSVTFGANFTGQIVLQLSNVPVKFNACAYATDYPPNIASISGGTYTLKGTQSFILNGASISGNKYTGSINTLTDPTGCPGCIAIRDFNRSSSNVNIPCCPNLALVGNYCRDLAADAASTYICSDVVIEVKNACYSHTTWANANSSCTGQGWQLPTMEQITCLYSAGKLKQSASCCDCANTCTFNDIWTSTNGCRSSGPLGPYCENCTTCACHYGTAAYICIR